MRLAGVNRRADFARSSSDNIFGLHPAPRISSRIALQGRYGGAHVVLLIPTGREPTVAQETGWLRGAAVPDERRFGGRKKAVDAWLGHPYKRRPNPLRGGAAR